MGDLIREEADKYQDFFNFMSKEHNLTLTISEMNEIVIQAQKLVDNLPSGQSEQFICPCCGSDKTYKTDAIHCKRCAVTTDI